MIMINHSTFYKHMTNLNTIFNLNPNLNKKFELLYYKDDD